MYKWFFMKMSSMFFPSILHDVVLHDVPFVWIDLSFICPKFHHRINDIFCKHISYFCLDYKGPIPSSSYIFLFCPLLKILQFAPMSWPIVIRPWVELETTILLTKFLAFISSRLWLTFIPCQPFLMLSTISNAFSYCLKFTTTSDIALFKMGCFKSFSMANH